MLTGPKAGVLWRRTATFSRICESDRLDRSATGAFESSPERVRRAGGHSRNLDAGSRFRNPQSPAIFLYSRTAGRSRAHVARESVGDAAARDRSTLLVFAHPRCPCSRATIGELARIMAVDQGRVSATVFFYAPSTEAPDWDRTDLWRDASGIPGVRAAEDRDGSAARRFGAFTSGKRCYSAPMGGWFSTAGSRPRVDMRAIAQVGMQF